MLPEVSHLVLICQCNVVKSPYEKKNKKRRANFIHMNDTCAGIDTM